MALTLIEAAKLHSGDVLMQGIIEIYAQSVDILRVLPFESIQGNALKYNREEALPGIGFRGVNEGYSESTGILNPIMEPLVIAGGDLDVDMFILETMGQDQRSAQEAMKAKALSHKIGLTFVKGDSETTPKEFDGLQKRITGAQKIAAGSAANGDALSLAKLDEAIDAVDGPTHLLMSKAMRRRLTQAARNTAVGGFITWEKDAFGRLIARYQDLEILIADESGNSSPGLAFNEANPGGGTATGTSIYPLSLGEGKITGIQNGMPDVRDLGELQTKPAKRTRVEWYIGMAVLHPRSASRLWGIKDAAVVV